MEFLIGIATSIVGKAAEFTVEPVGRQIGYFLFYKTNVENLKAKIDQELNPARDRIVHTVEAATRNGQEIELDVKNWLSQVAAISDQGHHTVDGRSNCSGGGFSCLAARYWAGKRASKTARAVGEILEASRRFSTASYLPPIRSSVENRGYNSFETRTAVLSAIMEAVRDPDSGNVIGVWGMGGVGKTVLVREVARRSEAESLFGKVVVTGGVSQRPNLEKVQEEVAESLGLRFEERSFSARAKRLEARLRKESTVLVVVDDVWGRLDLEALGISFGDHRRGDKVIITSRSESVLCNEMGIEKRAVFRVGVLSDHEAAELFGRAAGDLAKRPDLEALGRQIVGECGGLPLAISAVGNALRGQTRPEVWKSALNELRSPSSGGADERVNSSIKLSYNHLRGDEGKSLLLLCCLHREDADVGVEDLLRYGLGLGLFRGISTVEDGRNRVVRLTESLKASSLLLDGERFGSVKMHDVVRDVVLSIALDELGSCCVRDVGELEAIQRRNKKNNAEQDLTAISLYFDPNDLIHHQSFLFPKLSFFMLACDKDSVRNFPDRAFEEMKELRVLSLSFVRLDPGNPYLSSLRNLQTLFLCGCNLGDDIAWIGELRCLEILNLSGSDFNAVPEQLGQLIRLRSLDLNHCENLRAIQPGVISSLTRLEELNIGRRGFSDWSNAILAELKSLARLTALHLNIRHVSALPEDLFSDRLERYAIHVASSGCNCRESKYGSRVIDLRGVDENLLDRSGIKTLVKRTEKLRLTGMKIADDVAHELDENGLSQLKILRFEDDEVVRNIVNPTGRARPLQSLEELRLESLRNLEKICNGELGAECFKRLRTVDVSKCNKLKSVFPFSVAESLERVSLSKCILVENVFAREREEDEIVESVEFPRLVSLKLRYLPRLRQFCGSAKKESELLDSTIPLFQHKFLASSACFQSLAELSLIDFGSHKYVFSSSVAESLVQLNRLSISDCSTVEGIIRIDQTTYANLLPKLSFLDLNNLRNLKSFCLSAATDANVSSNKNDTKETRLEDNLDETAQCLFDEKTELPNLKSINLRLLNKLTMIWKDGHEPVEDYFCKLEGVTISECNSLTKICYSNVLRRLRNLIRLRIEASEMMQYVFEIRRQAKVGSCDLVPIQLRFLSLHKLPKLKRVWSDDPRGDSVFKELKEVFVTYCPSLKSLFPASVGEGLLRLKSIRLESCDALEEVVAKREFGAETKLVPKFLFPKLTTVHFNSLPMLACFYHGLHSSEWPYLRVLLHRCSKVKIFASELLSNFQDKTTCDESRHYSAMFSMEKVVFPSLEELTLLSMNVDLHEVVGGEERYKGMFPRLRILKLEVLPELMHLFKDNSRDDALFRSLETLKVWRCEKLVDNPIPAWVTFRFLTTLVVTECHGVTSLLTSSTARGMESLKRMAVADCKKMTSVVISSHPNEGREIALARLQVLILSRLYNLASFHSGICDMRLPNLEAVIVHRCFRMQSFSSEAVAPKLKSIVTKTEDNYQIIALGSHSIESVESGFDFILNRVKPKEELWKGDINTTLQELYNKSKLLRESKI